MFSDYPLYEHILKFLTILMYGVRLILFPGSFVLTGLTEMAVIPFLGIDVEKLSLDDKAEILFLDQG